MYQAGVTGQQSHVPLETRRMLDNHNSNEGEAETGDAKQPSLHGGPEN